MKNIALLGLLILPFATWAQRDTVKVNINGTKVEMQANEKNIDVLVDVIQEAVRESQAVIAEQNQKIAEINKNLQDGNINEEEAKRLRKKIVDDAAKSMRQIEERMQQAGEAVGKRAEMLSDSIVEHIAIEVEIDEPDGDWAKKWEEEARSFDSSRTGNRPSWRDLAEKIDENDDDDDDFNLELPKKKTSSKRSHFVFDISAGWNVLVQPEFQLTEGNATLNNWRSGTWNFGFMGQTRMFGQSSKMHFKYGMNFSFNSWRLQGSNALEKDPISGDVVFTQGGFNNLQRSSFYNSFLNLPVSFQFDFSKNGIHDGFALGIGGYGGVRMHGARELLYSDVDNQDIKERSYNTWHMNRWRYGLMSQLGYGNFRLTAEYDLNTMFKEDRGPEMNNFLLTLGLVF